MRILKNVTLSFGKAALAAAVLLAAVLFCGCFGGTEAEMRQVESSRPSADFWER